MRKNYHKNGIQFNVHKLQIAMEVNCSISRFGLNNKNLLSINFKINVGLMYMQKNYFFED